MTRDPNSSSSAGPWGEPEDPTSAMPAVGQTPGERSSNPQGSGFGSPPWEPAQPTPSPQTAQPTRADQPGSGQQAYGRPPWQNQPGYEQQGPGYNQPGYGQQGPAYNQPGYEQQGPAYNQPGYGQQGPAYNQPGYGQQGYNYNEQGRNGQPGLGPFGPRPEGTGTTPTWTAGIEGPRGAWAQPAGGEACAAAEEAAQAPVVDHRRNGRRDRRRRRSDRGRSQAQRPGHADLRPDPDRVNPAGGRAADHHGVPQGVAVREPDRGRRLHQPPGGR